MILIYFLMWILSGLIPTIIVIFNDKEIKDYRSILFYILFTLAGPITLFAYLATLFDDEEST